MNSTLENDISLKENPDLQFFISYDFYNITNPHFYAKGLYEYYAGKYIILLKLLWNKINEVNQI